MASKAIWYDYVTISSVSKVSNLAGEQLHKDASTSDEPDKQDKSVIAFKDTEDNRMRYYLFEDPEQAKKLYDFIFDREMWTDSTD